LNDRDVIEFTRDAKLIYSRARTCTACGAKRAGASPACATIRPARTPNTTACWTQDPASPIVTFDLNENIAAPFIATGVRPRVAILREQGVNSHIETAT
jgi:phosphoribosylformylglycinamidine synthase